MHASHGMKGTTCRRSTRACCEGGRGGGGGVRRRSTTRRVLVPPVPRRGGADRGVLPKDAAGLQPGEASPPLSERLAPRHSRALRVRLAGYVPRRLHVDTHPHTERRLGSAVPMPHGQRLSPRGLRLRMQDGRAGRQLHTARQLLRRRLPAVPRDGGLGLLALRQPAAQRWLRPPHVPASVRPGVHEPATPRCSTWSRSPTSSRASTCSVFMTATPPRRWSNCADITIV